MSADPITADVVERFVRYAKIDTQADPTSDAVPSTAKQLELSRLLVDELHGLGIADARLDEHGYVLATVPATVAHPVGVVALFAHVDVAPDAPADDVQPQLIDYPGGVLPLPGDPSVTLDPAECPELDKHLGHRLITSDGRTLLGADDKAGVAAMMSLAAVLTAQPEIPHGEIRLVFTRDEEVGRGVALLDLEAVGADYGYTVDGGALGTIEDETFNALELAVTFTGIAAHPGAAKGKMVNAVKVAARFIDSLPADAAPETTEGRQGFINPMLADSAEEQAVVRLNIRDFDRDQLAALHRVVQDLAEAAVAAYPGSSVRIEADEPYQNMKEYLKPYPEVIEAAEEAIRRVGLEPRRGFIRGGTDGSKLSQLGLPTPNLFAGMHNIHSRNEWVCTQDLTACVRTLIELTKVWTEKS